MNPRVHLPELVALLLQLQGGTPETRRRAVGRLVRSALQVARVSDADAPAAVDRLLSRAFASVGMQLGDVRLAVLRNVVLDLASTE